MFKVVLEDQDRQLCIQQGEPTQSFQGIYIYDFIQRREPRRENTEMQKCIKAKIKS